MPTSPESLPTQRVSPRKVDLEWQPLQAPGFEDSEPQYPVVHDVPIDLLTQGRLLLAGGEGMPDLTLEPGPRRSFQDVFVTGDFVVAVSEDKLEERDSVVTVVDTTTGQTSDFASMDVPHLFHGGSWAGYGGLVAYPTVRGSEYCIAVADLHKRTGTILTCVPPRNGLNDFAITPAGVGYNSFDNRRPSSCRTANIAAFRADGTLAAPTVIEEATPCKAWEVLPLPGGGAVWSEVVNERRIERSRWLARDASGVVHDLGPGATGSLIWCNDAAWWIRAPANEGLPARAFRYSNERGLEQVYATAPRDFAFLGPPQCGDEVVALIDFSEFDSTLMAARVR